MIDGLKVLAIIAARGGSKGVPRKNLKELNGLPLIDWTLKAALNSKHIDTVILSTDDREIATHVESLGVEVPFMRPAELATDNASSIDVVRHALKFLKSNGRVYDIFVLLEPTSPLRTSLDIDAALKFMLQMNSKAVVGIGKTESCHPSFLFELNNKMRLKPLLTGFPNGVRRQDISPVYFAEGSIYASEINEFFKKGSYYHSGTTGFEMPKWKTFEIDDFCDFVVVESLMKYMENNNEL